MSENRAVVVVYVVNEASLAPEILKPYYRIGVISADMPLDNPIPLLEVCKPTKYTNKRDAYDQAYLIDGLEQTEYGVVVVTDAENRPYDLSKYASDRTTFNPQEAPSIFTDTDEV